MALAEERVSTGWLGGASSKRQRNSQSHRKSRVTTHDQIEREGQKRSERWESEDIT